MMSVERTQRDVGGVTPKTVGPVQCISGTRPPESLAMSYEGRCCFSAAKAPRRSRVKLLPQEITGQKLWGVALACNLFFL